MKRQDAYIYIKKNEFPIYKKNIYGIAAERSPVGIRGPPGRLSKRRKTGDARASKKFPTAGRGRRRCASGPIAEGFRKMVEDD
jgi:hypothetical protein